MRYRRGSIRVLVGLAVWLVGCAHYSTTAGMIGGIRRVAIPVAENQTPEPAIAEQLTERLSQALTRDGRLAVVDEESADALLQVRVMAVEDRPFTYTAQEQTQQYRFKVLVDVLLVKIEDESRLLELKGLQGWSTYGAALADEEGRDRAVEAGVDMVIEEVVDRLTSTW